MSIEKLKTEIDSALEKQVNQLWQELTEIDSQLVPIANSLQNYLASGKRFRPLFALIGCIGAGAEVTPSILNAANCLELLQACALIHDDLMDGSDTRRGEPAIHKQFSAIAGENFGAAAAILIGDLALSWSHKLLNDSGIPLSALTAATQVHSNMQTELMAGQFLDVFEQTQNNFSVERALKIARFKSGKYSIERPLHFGAALAQPKELDLYFDIYSEYGLPLGEAFQLRDDLLGVYGDPNLTGKPAGDDLREGKRTALIAFAYDRGSNATKHLISSMLGTKLTDTEIDQLRSAILESGAVIHVEDLIEKLAEASLDALERPELDVDAKSMLIQMVELVTQRTR